MFLHGLCENESYWNHHRDRTGTTYAAMLAERGWTPLMLRANTGLPLRENGAAFTALLQRAVEAWPGPVARIALVGHSLGGLVMRAAGAVASEVAEPWNQSVTDVITLGTPHLGAPIAWGSATAAAGSAGLPETAAFGRVLDWRSRGVHDLVAGLAEDVPPLPQARYHLVAARSPAASGTRSATWSVICWSGRDRRTGATGGAACSPTPTSCTWAGPPLRAAQPPRRARGDEALAGLALRSRSRVEVGNVRRMPDLTRAGSRRSAR